MDVTEILFAAPVNATAPVTPFTDCTLTPAGEKLTQFASVLAGSATKIKLVALSVRTATDPTDNPVSASIPALLFTTLTEVIDRAGN